MTEVLLLLIGVWFGIAIVDTIDDIKWNRSRAREGR